ncbi:MAG: hypothetical protein IPF94_15740 [Betaproteobacteria bacterium]|nr:hypothetical protein [Betaproteobacteria bacterium]
MTPARPLPSTVTATALEVLPGFGIAYFVDDQEVSWAVTKSTQGRGLHSIQPGQRVRLTLDHAPEFSLVSAYQSLD